MGTRGAVEGGQRVLEGLRRLRKLWMLRMLWRLWTQECIGAVCVYSNAGGELDVWTRV